MQNCKAVLVWIKEPAGLKLLWEELIRDFAVIVQEVCRT